MNYFRHGDLSFHPIKKIVGKLQKHSGSFVLAEGEATGHNHIITKERGTMNIYKDVQGNLVLEIDGRALLTHPEHKTIEFKTGTFKVVHEREYNHFSHSIHKVVD